MKKRLLIGLASLAGLVIIIIAIIEIIDATTPRGVLISLAVGDLNVTPTVVGPGETVTVTLDISNTGKESGTREWELIINGVVEQSKNVTHNAGETTSISFFVEKYVDGPYIVELAGQIRIFDVVTPPPEPLTVHFIDVGQGDSILLDLGDTEVLIDGGEKSPGVVSYIGYFVDGPLEVMIATHPHTDHIGGLIAVLDAFEVGEIWLNGDTSTSQTYTQFISTVNPEGANVYEARRGDAIQAGNLTFNVLHPADLSDTINNNSIVLSLSYGQVDFLFTGDAEEEAEASMLADGIVPDVEILKVGHHGSRTASSMQFLQAAKPECAIYMAGEGNSYGHPHHETYINLCEVGAEIYGTDIHGTIVITTDGGTYDVVPSNNVPPVVCPSPETEEETSIGSDIQITYIFYDGVVYQTESDEYVEIRNLGDASQDLDGWELIDISDGYPSFTFPSYILVPGAKIRVYTNEIHPEWGGFSFGWGKAVWNNSSPDTAVLNNAQGQEVSRKSY